MSETVLILLENKIFTIFFTVWMRGEYEELGWGRAWIAAVGVTVFACFSLVCQVFDLWVVVKWRSWKLVCVSWFAFNPELSWVRMCWVVLLWWGKGTRALGDLSYNNDALLMQICLVTGSMREPAGGGLGVKPQLTLLMCIISLVRLCLWGGWECGDLGVPYLGKTSAPLISINLWALQIYPHLSGLATSLQ